MTITIVQYYISKQLGIQKYTYQNWLHLSELGSFQCFKAAVRYMRVTPERSHTCWSFLQNSIHYILLDVFKVPKVTILVTLWNGMTNG